MRSSEIQRLISAVEQIHGPITLYGSNELEEHGTCFTLKEIPATFSVLTLEGTLAHNQFDVQIEGQPPGDYVYYLELCSLDRFLQNVALFKLPTKNWP
jgi:hypothetical protein